MYNHKEYQKNYYENNKEELNKKSKEWGLKNKEKVKEYRKEYNLKNNNVNKERSKKWALDNKDKSKEWVLKNKEKIKKYKKEYRLKNKEKIKEDYKKWRLENKQCRIRRLIGNSFKNCGYKKNTKTEKILGCTFEQFKTHIENQFENWMSFDNHGKYNGEYFFGWDIDHIVELKSAKTEEDILILNHYSNLRPLDSKINRVDRNKKRES